MTRAPLWVGDVFAARPGQRVNNGIMNDAGLALIIYTSPSLRLVFTVYFLPWELAGAKYKLQKAGGAAAARKIKAGVRGEGGNSGQEGCIGRAACWWLGKDGSLLLRLLRKLAALQCQFSRVCLTSRVFSLRWEHGVGLIPLKGRFLSCGVAMSTCGSLIPKATAC